jgi:O-methyltransferase
MLSKVPRLASRVRTTLERRRHFQRLRRIYDDFQDFTMIPPGQFMTNLELAESVRHLPGCIIECGVWRGGMSAGMAVVLGPHRHYFLFDSFEGLPKVMPIDGESALRWQQDTASPGYHDNCCADESFARSAMAKAGACNSTFIKGWFENTLPKFTPSGPIALLRLDGDWYESTTTCLEHLFPHVVPGGAIIIDDYYAWEGCARAVHDYLSRHERTERITSHQNVCLIQKRGTEA